MHANRNHYQRPCATTRLERQQQRVHEVRKRVLKARARNHYNPLGDLQALNNFGLLVITVVFCAFAIGAL